MSQALIETAASNSDNAWLVGSTLLGATVGGIVSGATGWLIALDTRRRTISDIDRGAALQLVVKAKMLADAAYSIRLQIETTIADAEKAGLDGPTWTKLPGIKSLGESIIRLEPEEIALLVRMKNDRLTNDFILVSQRGRSLDVGLETYYLARTSLDERLPAFVDGKVGITQLTEEQFKALGPTIANIALLADNVRDQASEQLRDAMHLARDIGPAIRKYLKDKNFPINQVPNQDNNQAKAEAEK